MYFIGTISTFVLVNFILSNLGPILFYIIQLFSRIQLFINLTPNPTKHLTNEKNELDKFDCFVGNQLVQCDPSENAIEKINGSEITVLISGKHMVCFYPPIEEYNSTNEASNVRFISVKIEIGSVEYDIKMCGPTYSFYVVGNDLNVDWVRYYFLKFKDILLPANVEYQLTVIDDDVNFIVLNQFECIGLDRDEYNVYTYVVDNDEDEGVGNNEDGEDVGNVMDELVSMLETEEQMILEMNEERNIEHALKCILEEDEEINRIIAEYENMTSAVDIEISE
jgi:hypothetical protein